MKRIFSLFLSLLAALTAMAQLPNGYTPCSVGNLTAEWIVSPEGSNNVVLSFTAPTQMLKYDMNIYDYVYADMDAEISRIVVQRSVGETYSFSPVATVDSPVKGESYTIVDEGVAYGTYRYRVVVFVGSSQSSDWDWDNAIRTVLVGQVPADYEDEDILTSVEGHTVRLSYRAPEFSSLGAPMTDAMTCNIAEVTGSEPPTFTEIHKQENAVPGQMYEVVLENVTDGTHTYAFQASTVSGANNGIYRYCINLFVGQDVPGSVRHASASVTTDGVNISWEAPLTGKRGGDMGDPAAITYTVIRKGSVYEAEGTVIANAISELACFDNISASSQKTYLYEIIASNAMGEGDGVFTNSVLVGPSLVMPFVENFDTVDPYGNVSFDHVWLHGYSGSYCTWYTAEQMYVGDSSVMPHNGNGLGYAMYSSWGTTHKWDALLSAHLDCSAVVKPVLTFWLFDLAYGGTDVTLNVQTTLDDGVTFTDALSVSLGEAEATGWRQLSVELPAIAGANNAQIRFQSVADGSKCYPVVIDEITLQESSAEAVEQLSTSETAGLRYNLSGQVVVKSQSQGLLIQNGKVILNR